MMTRTSRAQAARSIAPPTSGPRFGTRMSQLARSPFAATSIKDVAGQADVKKKINDARNKTQRELESYGYPTIPSQANFFMVSLEGRTVQPVIQEFRDKGILVGRPFPPMINHLRVSVGTPEDMDKFMKAFKEIFPKKAATTMARG